ncbi:hypothetical protein [Methylomonas fluvii]|uniref:YkuD domain-containing protein n=1 Tax=Methylomonas fluvii TaxID=1854564 RepID=A0ABR9DFP0_9GAMM|nr:hypothetical protein [Methylomonas fluvii]MBD9361765.1 hypothetical protein [Methylomonas fluvii]CAD6874772.1 hypothetical protein [Methylomonas fluvii]
MNEVNLNRRRILLTTFGIPALAMVACSSEVVRGEKGSPNYEDIKKVNEIINSLQSSSGENLGELYDNQIYPEAFRLAQAAINSLNNVDWKRLFIQLYIACKNLNDEGLYDLLTNIQEAEQSQVTSRSLTPTITPLEVSINSLLPPELRDEYHVLEYDEYLSRAFDPGPPIPVDGCSIVFAASQERASHKNHPIRFGTLFIKKLNGSWVHYQANTGGSAPSFKRRGGPLPPGRYNVNHYRPDRHDVPAMMVEGVSYSFDVLPETDTNVYGRSLFRIHPDGRAPGTLGCIGIAERSLTKQQECENILREIVLQHRNVKLAMTNYSIASEILR